MFAPPKFNISFIIRSSPLLCQEKFGTFSVSAADAQKTAMNAQKTAWQRRRVWCDKNTVTTQMTIRRTLVTNG